MARRHLAVWGALLAACAPRTTLFELWTQPAEQAAPTSVQVPLDAQIWYARARWAAELGDLEEARRSAAWVQRLDPEGPWSQLALGRLSARLGDLEGATSALSGLRAPATDAADAWALRAWVATQRGEDPTDAWLEAARRDVRRWPDVWADVPGPRRGEVLDAWLDAPVPEGDRDARGEAAASQARWDHAEADLGAAFAALPSARGLVRWADVASRACKIARPWSWVRRRDPSGWGPGWPEAVVAVAQAADDPTLGTWSSTAPRPPACEGAEGVHDAYLARPTEPGRLEAWAARLDELGRGEEAALHRSWSVEIADSVQP